MVLLMTTGRRIRAERLKVARAQQLILTTHASRNRNPVKTIKPSSLTCHLGLARIRLSVTSMAKTCRAMATKPSMFRTTKALSRVLASVKLPKTPGKPSNLIRLAVTSMAHSLLTQLVQILVVSQVFIQLTLPIPPSRAFSSAIRPDRKLECEHRPHTLPVSTSLPSFSSSYSLYQMLARIHRV